MLVKYKAKVWKTGSSYVLTVPKAFIDSNILNDGEEYEISLENTDSLEGDKNEL